MPRSIYDVLRWCEYVWLTYGTYRMASQRVVRYFLTKVELTDASDDEKEKYEEFLENDIQIMPTLAVSGDNYMCYGQDILSLHVPFRRHLRCPKCKTEKPINKVKYSWSGWGFQARCDACSHSGVFERVDRRSLGADPLRVIHWSPHEIRILYHPITGKTVYHWEIPGSFKTMIKNGNMFYLEHTPWEVIEAIRDDQLFRFNDDVIYHLKDEQIAGVKNYGWGIPLIMSNFKQAWYIQVLKRYNEAVALDYIMPWRILTPEPGSSREADPVLHINMNQFYSRVMQMYKQHRKDPTTIHALPFPVKMQMLGGDGKQLAPIELIDKGTDEFLNAQGVPAELYRGSLQVNAAPVALRLFERTWVHMVTGMNGLLNWLFKRVSELQNWENLKGRLQPTTLADSIEDRQIRLQLAAGQQISRQTAFAPFGINTREEVRRMLEEEQFQREEMQRFQEESAQKQELQQTMAAGSAGQIPGVPGMMPPGMPPGQPGMAPPGAMPPGATGQMPPGAPGAMPMGGGMMPPAGGGASNAGVTPEDLAMQAEQIANQMLTIPYELRRGELNKIKKSNETLHSLVIAKMQKVRQTAQTQGGFQMLQQMTGAPR